MVQVQQWGEVQVTTTLCDADSELCASCEYGQKHLLMQPFEGRSLLPLLKDESIFTQLALTNEMSTPALHHRCFLSIDPIVWLWLQSSTVQVQVLVSVLRPGRKKKIASYTVSQLF
ncbi:unnamed protein product [Victoria cruziana]